MSDPHYHDEPVALRGVRVMARDSDQQPQNAPPGRFTTLGVTGIPSSAARPSESRTARLAETSTAATAGPHNETAKR